MLESFFNLLAYGKQWKIKILHFFTSYSYIFMHKIIKMPLSEDSYTTKISLQQKSPTSILHCLPLKDNQLKQWTISIFDSPCLFRSPQTIKLTQRFASSKKLGEGKNGKGKKNWKKLTLSAHFGQIVPLPCSTTRASDCLGISVSLAQTARHLASRGETTQLPVLVYWVTDPLKLGVTTYSLVENINHNDLVELVGGILCYPVGVQHTKATTFLANTFLSKLKLNINWTEFSFKKNNRFFIKKRLCTEIYHDYPFLLNLKN